jgi:hypothetical protein
MNRLPTKPDETPTNLFNPSLESFTFIYDKKEYILPAYGIENYPKYLADRLASSLADTIIGKRGVIKNHSLDKEELLKEIYVG